MNHYQHQNQNHNTQTQQNQQQQANLNPPNQNTMNQLPPNHQTNQEPTIIMKLMNSCLPVLLEQFTGQSMPLGGNSSNNNMEMSLALSQVLTLQQQIITGQRELTNRIVNLETRANQQFSGLVQQVQKLGSVRLTHDRERKQIEFNQNLENHEN